MGESKHTQGPWYAREALLAGRRARMEVRTQAGGIGEPVAVMVADDKSPDAVQANARLIAAAPAYARAWAMVPENIRESILAAADPWVADSIDAHAKAEGREP